MGACTSRVLKKSKKGEMECLSPIEGSSTPKDDTVPDSTEPPVSAAGEEKDRSDGKGGKEGDGSGGEEEEEEEENEIVEDLKKCETSKEWHKEGEKRRSLSILFEENDKSERPSSDKSDTKGENVDVEPSEAVKPETSMKIDNDEPSIEEESSSESKKVEVDIAESNQFASGTEVTDRSGGSEESELNVVDVKLISDESDQKEQPPIDVREPVTEAKIKPGEGTVESEELTSFNVIGELKEGMENLKDGLKSLMFGHDDATVALPTSGSTLPTETVVTEEKEKEVDKGVKIEEISKEVESSKPTEEFSKH